MIRGFRSRISHFILAITRPIRIESRFFDTGCACCWRADRTVVILRLIFDV